MTIQIPMQRPENTVPPVLRFERLYAENPDPWEYRTSSYEEAKYQATLAALPTEKIERVLEVGCSIGVFTEMLAARYPHVTAVDFSPRAVSLARQNLKHVDNVEVLPAAFPYETPAGEWDLIVCSEVLYYLEPESLDDALRWLQNELHRGASLVTVNWTGGDGADEPLTGEEVHELLCERLGQWHTHTGGDDGYRIARFEGRRLAGRRPHRHGDGLQVV